jgi:CheY-like chemotaxis protein
MKLIWKTAVFDALFPRKCLRLGDSLGHNPIVAVTGDLMNYNREVALQAGCNDFIEKPFTLATLESLFRRYGA